MPSLTLAQAADRARAASFDVRAAIEAARMARADAASARAGLRPQLGISATALDANLSLLGMPVASQAYVGVTGSLPLLTPSIGSTARASGLTADAATSDLDAARNDAFFAAVQAYRRPQLALVIVDARAAQCAISKRISTCLAFRALGMANRRHTSRSARCCGCGDLHGGRRRRHVLAATLASFSRRTRRAAAPKTRMVRMDPVAIVAGLELRAEGLTRADIVRSDSIGTGSREAPLQHFGSLIRSESG